MKKPTSTLFLFTALFVILLTSCNKISTPDEASKSLFGKWEYQSNSGGFSGNGGSNKFNENSWVDFSKKGVYTVYEGNTKKQKLNFTISPNEGMFKYKINFTDSDEFNYTYIVEDGKLYLSENVSDGFIYTFTKK